MKISAGDRVVIDADRNKYPKIKMYTQGVSPNWSLSESDDLELGARGTVLGMTAPISGENRFVRVLFANDKIGYVSEIFVKKVEE